MVIFAKSENGVAYMIRVSDFSTEAYIIICFRSVYHVLETARVKTTAGQSKPTYGCQVTVQVGRMYLVR